MSSLEHQSAIAASAGEGAGPAAEPAPARPEGSGWLRDGRFVSTAAAPLFRKHADVPSILVSGRVSDAAPLVSIVIPTFRRPQMLSQAIESALAQTVRHGYEVIVVDNDPEAGGETAAVVAAFDDDRLFYFRNERNLGMEGNFNRTIEIGRGRYICQLHDDDWLSPHYLERLLARLPPDAEFLSSLTGMGSQDYDPAFIRPAGKPGTLRKLSKLDALHAIVSVAPALYRRSTAIELGGYDSSYYPVLDYQLFVQFVARGRSYVLKETLSYYRTTDSVTFKGDTLRHQISGSMTIKRRLVGDTQPLLGRFFYIESVRRQFQWAKEFGLNPASLSAGRLDRIAEWLAQHDLTGRAFGRGMQVLRGALLVGRRISHKG